MDGISHIAAVAAETPLSSADLLGLRRSLRTHATGGLLVLLALVALSIYKPRGMTRYGWRSEEHTSELQSLMRISYAVFCLKQKRSTNLRSTYHKNYTVVRG